MEFAILEQSWEEVFKERWREHVDIVLSNEGEVSNGSAAKGGGTICDGAAIVDATASEVAVPATDTAAASEATDANADPVAPVVKKQGKAKPKAAGSEKPRKREADATEAEEDKGVQRLLRESCRIKQDFLRTVSAAEELRSVIGAGGDFSWAQNNVQGDKRLASCTAALRSKLTDWSQIYLLCDSTAIKKNFTEARIIAELTTFVSLAPHIAQLSKTIRQIMAATAAMQGD